MTLRLTADKWPWGLMVMYDLDQIQWPSMTLGPSGDCMTLSQEYSSLSTNGPFYLHGLTLIPAWISNHMPNKVPDEITYPFLNFNGATVEV